MRQFIVAVVTVFITMVASAQDNKLVQFDLGYQRVSDSIVLLTIKARMKEGMQLFSVKKISPDDPFASMLLWDSSIHKEHVAVDSSTETGNALTVKDSSTHNNYRLFADSVTFNFPIALK